MHSPCCVTITTIYTQKLFVSPVINSLLINTKFPFPLAPPNPQVLVVSILLSISKDLPIPGTSYKWSRAIFVLLCLAY